MNLCNDLYQENLKSQEFPYFLLRVIHKPCGQNFGLFYPPPPLWTILLNMVYVVCNMDIWQTPSPVMSAWFMNDPMPIFKIKFLQTRSM